MLLELTSCWADTQIQETLTARRRPPSARPNTFLPSSVQGSGVEFSVDSQQQSCSLAAHTFKRQSTSHT